MSANIVSVRPQFWRCRTCGETNTLTVRLCASCSGQRSSPDARALQNLFENVAAQVVNSKAEVVYNNIYNFAPESNNTIMTPEELDRAATALDQWVGEQPRPKRSSVLNILLGVLTCVCIIIMVVVCVGIITIFALGTLKAFGH